MAEQKQDDQHEHIFSKLCEDTGCSSEDQPEAMNDREKWRERLSDMHATSTTWYIYIYIERERESEGESERETFLYLFEKTDNLPLIAWL